MISHSSGNLAAMLEKILINRIAYLSRKIEKADLRHRA